MKYSVLLSLLLCLFNLSLAAQTPRAHDSAFAAMQERGKLLMGVDQYTSTHHFDDRADGGRMALERDVDDSAGVARIREHMRAIAQAFKAGDFSTPMMVHLRDVPGSRTMAAKRGAITYEPRDLPRGAELLIKTSDPEAQRAIHDFMAFQRSEHLRAPSPARP
jgi:hypothetical protein